MNPIDDHEFRRWYGQAASARVTAHLAAEGGQHGWACFLSEQAAQFAVKGLLHGIGEPAWGHDLTVLEQRGRDLLDWPDHLAELAARLSRHYIPTRYPDAHASGMPGEHYLAGDAEAAMRDADELLQAVQQHWDQLAGAGSEGDDASGAWE